MDTLKEKQMVLINKQMSRENGFTITEVLVALGLSAIVMLGIISMMDILNKNNLRQGMVQTRAQIISKIRIQALNFDNLKASALVTKTLGAAGLVPDIGAPNSIDHFDMLAKCMPEYSDGAAVGCDKTVMDVANLGNQFYLADNLSLDPTRTIAGEDVFYRSNGQRCSAADAVQVDACPLLARVWFEPYCLNFAKTCNKAMSIVVRYSVGSRDGTTISNLAKLEGEVYVPVQKGIQLSRLLNENDVPIPSNSFGIFAVQKYYGAEPAAGLRFEAIISNPTGLVSMKLQKRAIVGVAAKDIGEDVIPAALEAEVWQDVPTPGNVALGPWAISLANGRPNQIFNFGTQVDVVSNSRPATAFTIGTNDPNDSTYRWTRDPATSAFIAPTFKSGIYQFRVVAQDANGLWAESTNYFTVRIVGRPEVLFVNPSFNQQRDCAAGSFNYNILIGDDENITDSNVTLNGTDLGSAPVGTDHSAFTVPFDLSQPAGSYSLVLTAKNRFSDTPLEAFTIPSLNETRVITLSNVPPQFQSLTNNPTKIRLSSTGQVTASYVTGNCCVQTPAVNWTYPISPAFGGVALLSGPATSAMTCSSAGNTRTCTSVITGTGEKEGPPGNTAADIMATLSFTGVQADACKMPSPSFYSQSKYIPVVKNPTISFYLTESIWLTLPLGSAKAITPRVVVRADFAPEENIVVQVVKASDSSVICDVQFDGSPTPGAAIDKFCNIPPAYSGDLFLQKHPAYAAKIQYDSDPALSPSPYKARITGSIVHRTCSANVTDISDQAPLYSVSIGTPMEDSPWGYTLDGLGNKVQNSKNDAGKWTVGANKRIRCYDEWTGFINPNNKQDYYSVYKYNTEDKNPYQLALNRSIGEGSTPLAFASFIFPGNPPLIIDMNSKNIPYLYAVYPDGVPPTNIVWQYSDSGGSAGQTIPQPMQDVTSQVCAGVGTLSKVKLYRALMNVQSSSGNIILKAANGVSGGGNGIHSYIFMCEYGRWHPSGANSVNWID